MINASIVLTLLWVTAQLSTPVLLWQITNERPVLLTLSDTVLNDYCQMQNVVCLHTDTKALETHMKILSNSLTIYIEVHLNKLECRGKVNLFQ